MPLSFITTPLLTIALVAAWHFYVTIFDVSSFIMPAPESVAHALIEQVQDPKVWLHAWATVYASLVGFLYAVLIGVALGALIGKFDWLEKTLNPFIVATQVIPKVALVPLFIVWFGFGSTSKIIIAAVLAFFPIMTNTALGVKSVSIGYREVMASIGATPWSTMFRLELPNALPYILTGMEVGIVLAVIGAVVGEFLAGSTGLGYLLVAKMNNYETAQMFGILILLTAIGFIFYLAIGLVRHRIIPWHESVTVN